MALKSEKNVRMARILPVSIYEKVIGLDRDKFVDCCKLNFFFKLLTPPSQVMLFW